MLIKQKVVLLLFVLSVPFVQLTSLELGASLNAGGSVWGGTWTEKTTSFSEDFGQNSVPFILPALSLSADIMFFPWNLFNVGFAIGGGSWGGRVILEGGSGSPSVTSIATGGFEFSALIGKRFSFWNGILDLQIKAGVGSIETPLYIWNTWQHVTSVQTITLDSGDSLYVFSGISAAYGRPVGNFILFGNLFFDAGAGLLTSIKDIDYLFRFGIGLRLSRNFTRKQEVQ